jgi:hypothetical protein
MSDTIDVNYIPIEYKVLAYRNLFSHKSELIYARKISNFAVVITDYCTGSSVDTNIFFETDKYAVQKNDKTRVAVHEKLEILGITRITAFYPTINLDKILEPASEKAKWYDTGINLTSLFRNNKVTK